jgi:23S rRNA (adenine2030-N6)-methyltransferase
VNYRHAFHAGNFADCTKHALLVWIVRALRRKPAPFRVLDTHAGAGAYDLGSEEARRGGEWQAGVGRLLDVAEGPLADYAALVREAGAPPARYPGSPALLRALLRPEDRLVCVELHPEEHAALRSRFRADPQVSVHQRDAWEALRALTPFPERRGLVLMDPPFEQPGEFERLSEGLALVARRFRGAVQAAWYPVKHRAPIRAFHALVETAGLRDVVAAELWLREPIDPSRLNGCGLLVVNPPWGFEAEARGILAALLDRLGTGERGQGWAVTRIAAE